MPIDNETVREYLLKKRAEREALQQEVQADESAPNVSAALAALGAGFQRKDSGAAANAVLERQAKERQSKLTDFDAGTDRYMKDLDATNMADKMDREKAQLGIEDDVDSDISNAYDSMLRGMGYAGPKVAASKAKSFSPVFEKKYAADQAKLARQDSLNLRKDMAGYRAESKSQQDQMNLKNIPLEDRVAITKLAGTTADQASITNAIDATIDSWKGMGDDEKLQSMKQLIKTLNSTQGKDAVGAEELKRLAAKLEFAKGNFFNDNPVQFGRDLPGFEQDARNTSAAIKDATKRNEAEIAKRKGVAPPPQQYPKQVRKGNQMATVNNAQEEQEAKAEGFI